MSLSGTLSNCWLTLQGQLFPWLQEELGPLGDNHKKFITVLGLVRGVTGEEKASFFDWHPISGEWSIGSYQMRSLRTAMKYENSLPLPPKSYAD